MGHKKSCKKSLIERSRKGRTHIDNCATGYFTESHKFTQIHHIVCVSSMSNATISDLIANAGQTEFVRECLKLTNWNINDEPNTVGLPLKRAFVKKLPAAWNGWPCHQVDHNPLYTDAVSKGLNRKVWQKVLEKRKKCSDCATECMINAESVEKQLNAQSVRWRNFLKARGSVEEGGTALCWQNRKSMPGKWYIPFSMDPSDDPPAREAPDDWDGSNKTLKEYLSKVMFAFV